MSQSIIIPFGCPPPYCVPLMYKLNIFLCLVAHSPLKLRQIHSSWARIPCTWQYLSSPNSFLHSACNIYFLKAHL
jgi:hypothetical protein